MKTLSNPRNTEMSENVTVQSNNTINPDNPEKLDNTRITDKLDKHDRPDKPVNQYKTKNTDDRNDEVRITGNFIENYYGTSIHGK